MAEYLKAGFGLINGLGEEQFEKLFQDLLKSYAERSQNVCAAETKEEIDSNDKYIIEKTLIFLLEQLLSTLDQKSNITTLIEKLKSIKAEKKAIMARCIENNLNSLKKTYIEGIIAGSNWYLDDFNWNVNVCLISSEVAKIKQALLQLELNLRKYDTKEEKRVIVELNNEELEAFIQNLYNLQSKLE